MLYALNNPLAYFDFIYCMEMYVKMCISCTDKDIYIVSFHTLKVYNKI